MANTKMIQEMLTRAIFEVFEKMYFVFFEPLKAGGGNHQMMSAIHFSGPARGTIQILLTQGVAETMARNMLNLEPEEIDLPIMADCVRESLNMICGNFVRRLDPEKVFDLSIPSFEMLSGHGDPGPAEADHQIRVSFVADCGQMRLILTAPEML